MNSIDKILTIFGPVSLDESNSLKKEKLHRVINILRHTFFYIIDNIIFIFNPSKKILISKPLEVHYTQNKKFKSNPLTKFLQDWDKPSLSATYEVLVIFNNYYANSLENKSLNFKYVKYLIIRSLKENYNKELGYFKEKNENDTFKINYTALKVIKLLSEINPKFESIISQELNVNYKNLTEYLFEQIKDDKEKIYLSSPNLSLLEEVISIIEYKNEELISKERKFISKQIEDHAFIENNLILGFKLYKNDNKPSLHANKSGLKLLNTLNKITNYKTCKEINVSSFITFHNSLNVDINRFKTSEFHSKLFPLYNYIYILETIENSYKSPSLKLKSEINEEYRKLDIILDNLHDKLYYKGGYLFNLEFYNSPNIFSTRLMIDMLSKRKKLKKINIKELEDFILDSYDFESKQFRFYPYRSWYYERNLKNFNKLNNI